MTAKWEKTESNTGVLEVEITSERFAQALDEAFKKVVKQVNLPGFRKGKVPRKIFEARFGIEALYQDAVDYILPLAYDEAVNETGIEPVAQPSVDLVQLEAGKPFIFKATVVVKPEVELGEYKGVEIEDKKFDLTEEDVTKELDSLRSEHAEIEVVEDGEVENGDTVNMDFVGTVDGEEFEGGEAENYQLEVGSGSFIPGFEEQLNGMKSGEERDIHVTFPDDYHVKDLAGKEAVFHIKLHDIKRKVLRELDDDFVQEISDFETVDEFVEDVRKKVAERLEQDHQRYVEDEVVKKVVANATVDIPTQMIEHEIDHQVENFAQQLQMQNIPFDAYLEFTGMSQDEIRQQFREGAENSVRTGLVLEAVASAENVEPTEEDVAAEVQKVADSAQIELDRVKEMLSMRDPGLSGLRSEVKNRKTVELLVENSKVS